MKIPDYVRIGGVEYEVIEGVHALNDGESLLYGRIDYRKSTIEISDVCEGHQMKCITLLHEVLHGIQNHAGLPVENEEAVVDMFARGLYQVLQDNGGALFDLAGREASGVKIHDVHRNCMSCLCIRCAYDTDEAGQPTLHCFEEGLQQPCPKASCKNFKRKETEEKMDGSIRGIDGIRNLSAGNLADIQELFLFIEG